MCMCQRNWIAIAIAIDLFTSRRQKKFIPPSNVQIENQRIPTPTTNYESINYELSPRLEWKKPQHHYEFAFFCSTSQNHHWEYLKAMIFRANFRNSTSCRTFDEVNLSRIHNSHLFSSCRRSAITKIDPEYHQNAMKSHVIINLSADILLRRLLT